MCLLSVSYLFSLSHIFDISLISIDIVKWYAHTCLYILHVYLHVLSPLCLLFIRSLFLFHLRSRDMLLCKAAVLLPLAALLLQVSTCIHVVTYMCVCVCVGLRSLRSWSRSLSFFVDFVLIKPAASVA